MVPWSVFILALILKVTTETEIENGAAETKKPVKKFGCYYYPTETYTLEESHNDDKPVWGDAVKRKAEWVFATEDEFVETLKKIRQIRQSALAACAINTVQTFIQAYDTFRTSNMLVKEFYKHQYTPVYPKENQSGNYITCLLDLYDRLVKEFKKIDKRFVLASVDDDAKSVGDKVFKGLENTSGPHEGFQNDSVVGLIRIYVNSISGYLVLDMKHTATDIPVVFFKDHKDQNLRVTGMNIELVYMVRGNPVAQYLSAKRSVYKNLRSQKYKRDGTLLIYAMRSICSFVRDIEKPMLLDSKLEISRFVKAGYYEAYCTVNLKDAKGTIQFDKRRSQIDVGINKEGGKETSLDDLINIDDDTKDYMSEVSEALQLEKNGLFYALSKIRDIWIKDKQFITNLFQLGDKGQPKKKICDKIHTFVNEKVAPCLGKN